MKTQLIMLPQPILVSDEEYKDGDFLMLPYSYEVRKCVNGTTFIEGSKKITAGILGLPSIDFSALSEEDCKKIGWVDTWKLAIDYCNNISRNAFDDKTAFLAGFKVGQSLNEKKVDVTSLLIWLNGLNSDDYHKCPSKLIKETILKIQSLSQPKVFDVEVEMEDSKIVEKHEFDGTNDGEITWVKQPKIAKDSIKIINIK